MDFGVLLEVEQPLMLLMGKKFTVLHGLPGMETLKKSE